MSYFNLLKDCICIHTTYPINLIIFYLNLKKIFCLLSHFCNTITLIFLCTFIVSIEAVIDKILNDFIYFFLNKKPGQIKNLLNWLKKNPLKLYFLYIYMGVYKNNFVYWNIVISHIFQLCFIQIILSISSSAFIYC